MMALEREMYINFDEKITDQMPSTNVKDGQARKKENSILLVGVVAILISTNLMGYQIMITAIFLPFPFQVPVASSHDPPRVG